MAEENGDVYARQSRSLFSAASIRERRERRVTRKNHAATLSSDRVSIERTGVLSA
jgi:hypothetical protein